ncbi:glutathione S-transferase protein [Ancylostoma caninum]|uniref:glutathione transferase n=1 Tax=Ancylostoma caninum TaxID=29170 RepID=A0A368GX51_ANCCA|nr:glutathione S-transferase protein [Ancylostoma caninum]
MVHYKLTYFDGRGAAETIRQLFVLAGQEYEDVRLSRDECLNTRMMPFSQMPVLEVDGKQLAQSFAIVRFLARKFGEALVDSIADQYKDFTMEVLPCLVVLLGFAEGDLEKLTEEVLLPAREKFFGCITKFLKESKSGYLVGDSLTFADLYVAEISAEFDKRFPKIYDGFPEVKAHAEKVRSIPALKRWIETQPETKF